jgi:K+ transporter
MVSPVMLPPGRARVATWPSPTGSAWSANTPFRECFNPEHGLPVDAEQVLAVLSPIFWALIIVVSGKYVLLIMRADNQGEGGILALSALALEAVRAEGSRTFLISSPVAAPPSSTAVA